MRTSAPASGSYPSTNASPRGADATRAGTATPEADVRRRAGRLEEVVCEAAGVRPEAVRRLRWTAAAFKAAAAR